jgi:hypothetical protein
MASDKHLEFIQSAISRLAGNSFQMKAWNVALATAAIGFAAAKDSHPKAAMLALIPSFVFWVLDAYYLLLERAFRNLYNEAVKGTATAYSMKIKTTVDMALIAFIRPSVLLIHATMMGVIYAVTRS